jgi:hypothetical protein
MTLENSDPFGHVGVLVGGGGPRCIARPCNTVSNYNKNHIWISIMTAAFNLISSVEMNSIHDGLSGAGRGGG